MGYLDQIFSLKGKVCLVTGASRGIGCSIADAFHNAGAIVYGLGRSKNTKSGASWVYKQCDVNNKDKVTRTILGVVGSSGHLDILVNAAGITNSHSVSNTDCSFTETIQTNLIAVYEICMIARQHMSLSSGGSIINITSIGSELGFSGNPGYVSSKGGLKMLTKALANDFAKYNIRVNNIAPGYIKTSMTEGSFDNKELNKERVDRMIIKRWGEPNDLAGAAILLASNASAYITGIDLFVDGGWTAKGL